MADKMRAAILADTQKIVIEDIPIPKPKGNEVLVEVKAIGVCRSDVSGYLGKHPMITPPIILGHECSGPIADMGEEVKGFEIGQKVAVETFFYVCGECPNCQRGEYNTCRHAKIIGHNVDGAFAEYVLANGDFVFPLPEGVSFEEGALTEPLSVGVRATKRCGIQVGDMVVVIGAGTIGMFTMQVAKQAGARVLIADIVPFKLELAKKLGVDYVVNVKEENLVEVVKDITSGEGADYVIEAVGAPQTIAQTVDLTRSGGTIMIIGFTGRDADEINLSKITLQQMRLLGILGFCHDYPTSLWLLATKKIDAKSLITHRFTLEETEKAINFAREGKDNILKAVVIP